MTTHPYPITSKHRAKKKGGGGIVNSLINNLPFELHLPSYNYCGPGTKLNKRLARGDRGINPLDEACKSHDIAYALNNTLEERHKADLELAAVAERRSRESSKLSERLAGLAINKIMKFKVKRGMGVPISKVMRITRKVVRDNIKKLKKNKRGNNNNTNTLLLNAAVKAAKRYVGGKRIKLPRVIAVPKKGGFLPLIPLLGALAAAGTLAGGVTTAAKNIYDLVHRKGEAVGAQLPGRTIGKGLYMAPYKKGMGLYLTPHVVKKN